jgi:hypothetical protein
MNCYRSESDEEFLNWINKKFDERKRLNDVIPHKTHIKTKSFIESIQQILQDPFSFFLLNNPFCPTVFKGKWINSATITKPQYVLRCVHHQHRWKETSN